ncbi:hypothetical protein NL676_004462 [Syzygium grande]|nr:hypothetical protein NL676_004462 [Syzygium grande]
MRKKKIYVEPRVQKELLDKTSSFEFVKTWQDDREIPYLHKKVDLLVTLGGDGTVLWAASLFQGPVPPVVSFNMGSLGFMTPFSRDGYKKQLESILRGDGLILSTTSGSTAYSLAAGGSMVHPQVPGIALTPICPHSLSFRPLILPDHVAIGVEVSDTGTPKSPSPQSLSPRTPSRRSSAWVSFDGKNREELKARNKLICSMAPWPVPTVCLNDSTRDFLCSILEGLNWNQRKTQSSDGPPPPGALFSPPLLSKAVVTLLTQELSPEVKRSAFTAAKMFKIVKW